MSRNSIQDPEIQLLGVSFKNAPLAVREALTFSPEESEDLLKAAKSRLPDLECLVLSTCNRTEFYLVAPLECESMAILLELLKEIRPMAPIGQSDCARYHYRGEKAVSHLLRVATGLDSAILGDVQILGQVKQAQTVSGKAGALGEFLNQMLTQSIHAGKRARTETAIGRGKASIGSALTGMLKKHLYKNDGPKAPEILVIGAGDVARNVCDHISKSGLGRITVINRNPLKADRLAQQCGGQIVEWSQLDSVLPGKDVVIAATSAPYAVLDQKVLTGLKGKLRAKRILLIDAGMPRNIEQVKEFEIWNIDQIREQQDGVLKLRQEAVPDVEKIVREEIFNWNQWLASRPLEALIKEVFRDAADVSMDLASDLSGIEKLDSQEFQSFLFRSFKKLLTPHVRNLRGMNHVRIHMDGSFGDRFTSST